MSDLAMTEARRQMIDKVRDGIVTYDGGSGLWRVSGESVAGWAGRTLSALRRNSYIELGVKGENAVYAVGLTPRGEESLA